MFWVAAAGPAANLLMALAWALVLRIVIASPEFTFAQAMQEMARVGVGINVTLMLLNLLPLPPLDGGRIAVSLLPPRAAWKFSRIEPYGLVILLALLFTGILERILGPLMGLTMLLIKIMFGI
jgi:Zn-dependent protease